MSWGLPKLASTPRTAALRAGLGIGTSGMIVAANAATGIIASRVLGPDGRAAFALIVVFAALSLTLGSVGVPEAIASRHIASTHRHWSELLSLSIIVSLPVTIVVVPVALLVASTESGSGVRAQLVVLALSLPLRAWGLSAAFVLLARGRVSLHQVLIAAMPLSVLLAMLTTLLLGFRSTAALGWAAVAGSMISSVLQVSMGALGGLSWPSAELISTAGTFAAKSWVGAAANSANQRADVVVLSMLADPEAVGIYANAASMASLAVVAAAAFGPRLRWAVANNFRPGMRRWLTAGTLLSVGLGIVGSVGAWALFGTIYGPQFESGRYVAAALVLIAPILTLSKLLAIVVAMSGSPGRVARAEVLGLAFGLATLVLFLPAIGLWAAVLGSFVGYVVSSSVEWQSARVTLQGRT